jgi:excisionase family DNA binding protein
MEQHNPLNGVGTMNAKAPKKPLNQPSTQVLAGDGAIQMSVNEPASGRRARRTSVRPLKNSDDFLGATCFQEQLTERQTVADDRDGRKPHPMPTSERLMMVEEVASMLGISVRFVWRLVARGELKRPVRLGRSRRWVYSDALAYVEKLKGERDRRAR